MGISYQAESRVEMLKSRVKRCVCKYCGGKLYLRKIILSELDDDRIELFCEDCGRMEYGVEKEIYRSAEYFVEEFQYNIYPDIDDNLQRKKLNIAKVCEIMSWENQMLGFLNEHGFTKKPEVNANRLGECIIFEEKDLEMQLEEEIDINIFEHQIKIF